jgi:phage terminase large subunit-like protein
MLFRSLTGSFLVLASLALFVPSTSAQEKKTLTPKQLDEIWELLTRSDDEGVKKAFSEGICKLAEVPEISVPWIKEKLKPTSPVDQKKVDKFIEDLDSNDPKTRETAEQELKKLGDLVRKTVEKKLADKLGSLELRNRLERIKEHIDKAVFTPEELRAWRLTEVLEMIGNDEAMAVLEALSKGAEGARLTEDAKDCLKRLKAFRGKR